MRSSNQPRVGFAYACRMRIIVIMPIIMPVIIILHIPSSNRGLYVTSQVYPMGRGMSSTTVVAAAPEGLVAMFKALNSWQPFA